MHQKLSAVLIGILFVLLSAFPNALMVGACLFAAIVLYGFLAFLERQKIDRAEDIEKQIKAIKEQINDIKLQRGLGR